MKYRLGTSVLVWCNQRLLIGRRLSKHQNNKMCFPGGHVDENETIRQAAAREVFEETGIVVDPNDLEAIFFTDALPASDGSGDLYITAYFSIRLEHEPVVENKEPHKCAGWSWIHPYTVDKSFERITDFMDDGVNIAIRDMFRQWPNMSRKNIMS